MNAQFSPVAGIFIVIMGLLFVFLFVAWCCKQCSQSKDVLAPLLSPHDPLYGRRYMTAVDVQTGLPVIVQSVGGRHPRSLVRVTSAMNDGRYSVNGDRLPPTYVHCVPPLHGGVARTPPPPYFEVCARPTV